LDFLEGEIKLVVSVAIFSGLELGGDWKGKVLVILMRCVILMEV
jgi:hypothetical protein